MFKLTCIAAVASQAAGFGLSSAAPHARALSRMSSPAMSSIYDFSAKTIDGKDTKLSDFKGKPVLILNVASL